MDVCIDDLAASVDLDGFAPLVVSYFPWVRRFCLAFDGDPTGVHIEGHDGGVFGVDDAIEGLELASVEEGF